MRGVILAGGHGTRLAPATLAMNKHMVPILNRPMIEYPIDTLKGFGITDILLVSGGNHIGMFAEYLGDGSDHGVRLTYKVQEEAGGIAQALALAKDFVGGNDGHFAVILGDNVFDPMYLPAMEWRHATIFIKKVVDPNRFGVPVFNKEGKLAIIDEKPKQPKSDFAVTGLYFYTKEVFEFIESLKPSKRGELEITDVNNMYIRKERCNFVEVPGFWSDAGTPESLFEVTKHVYERGR